VSLFEKLLKTSKALSRLAIWGGGTCILLISLFICAEVLLRKFFSISSGGADEISGYALAISFSWALSLTVINRAHVRIDAIYTRMGTKTQAVLDCLSILALTIYGLVLAYYCTAILIETVALDAKANTTLGTPLWIPQSLWLIGIVLFALTCVLLTILSFLALFKGDTQRVKELVGGITTKEEAQAGVSHS